MVLIICKSSFLSGQYTGLSSVSIALSLSLLTSSVSCSSAKSTLISASEDGGSTGRASALTSVKEAQFMPNWISSSSSLKSSRSSAMATFWLSLDNLDFRKQFTTVFVVRERTLSMQEGGPEDFTNFSKNISEPRSP